MNKRRKTCLSEWHVAVDASGFTGRRVAGVDRHAYTVGLRHFRCLFVVTKRQSRTCRCRCGGARRTAHPAVSDARRHSAHRARPPLAVALKAHLDFISVHLTTLGLFLARLRSALVIANQTQHQSQQHADFNAAVVSVACRTESRLNTYKYYTQYTTLPRLFSLVYYCCTLYCQATECLYG